MAGMGLSDKQQRFVAEYLIDLNASEAAKRAGYSEKTAYSQGQRLLKNAEISAAVTKGKAGQLETADLSATRILEEMRRIALADPRRLFDAAGNLKPIKDWSAEDAACLASFEVIIKNAQAGDGVTDTVHRVKVWDKTRALEMLAKHFGLLVERVRHEGLDQIAERLKAARKRATA